MSDIAPLADLGVGQMSKYVSNDDFGEFAGIGFMPRLELVNSSSNAAKDGSIQQGHYALVERKQSKDIGKEVQLILMGWRLKAMCMNDGLEIIYNPKHPRFMEINEQAMKGGMNGHLCGPEFLFWIPEQKKFVTMLFGSKTLRNEASVVKGYYDAGQYELVFRSTLHTGGPGGKHKWWGPVVSVCTLGLEQPPLEQGRSILTQFNNPPEREVSAKDEEAPAASDRTR